MEEEDPVNEDLGDPHGLHDLLEEADVDAVVGLHEVHGENGSSGVVPEDSLYGADEIAGRRTDVPARNRTALRGFTDCLIQR